MCIIQREREREILSLPFYEGKWWETIETTPRWGSETETVSIRSPIFWHDFLFLSFAVILNLILRLVRDELSWNMRRHPQQNHWTQTGTASWGWIGRQACNFWRAMLAKLPPGLLWRTKVAVALPTCTRSARATCTAPIRDNMAMELSVNCNEIVGSLGCEWTGKANSSYP